MKCKRYLIGVAAMYLLLQTSCSSMFYSNSNVLGQIKQGMSPEETTKILGEPEYRRLDYGLEEWEYRKMLNPLDSEATVIIVRFEEGRLVYMDSFKASERQPVMPEPPVTAPQEPPVVVVPGHKPRPVVRPISDKQFTNFYNKVKARLFKDEQMKLIRAGADNKYFTCQQCARMMSLYVFDDDKMEVLRIFAPRIVDKENYETVTKSLSLFEQEKAMKLLGI